MKKSLIIFAFLLASSLWTSTNIYGGCGQAVIVTDLAAAIQQAKDNCCEGTVTILVDLDGDFAYVAGQMNCDELGEA